MLTAIFLHGHLADKYGPRFDLDVSTFAEAVNLLMANFSTFARDLIGENNQYAIFVGKSNVGEDELLNPTNGQDIHIVPAVKGGSGMQKLRHGPFWFLKGGTNTGFFLTGDPRMLPSDNKIGQIARIIGGIVIVAIGIYLQNPYMVMMGMSMLSGGVNDYIYFSSLKKLPHYELKISGRTPSYNFNGPVNTVAQGNPVPICYGRLLVGSQVVSSQVTTV